MLVHLIADYGPGDLAFAEVRQRLAQHLPDAEVVYTPVPPFDTLSAGFCIAQLALGDGPAHRLIYCNVAPRADEEAPRADNEGERLVYLTLPSGVVVAAVNAGYTLSFLAGEAESLHEVEVSDTGSQFRSRDAFPPVLPQLLGLLERPSDIPGPSLDPATIPPPPEATVIYVDGYGNLKTSWTRAPAQVGARVEVRIGDMRAVTAVSDGTFAVPAGEMAFAPGSSGWQTRDGETRQWYELLLRGDSAARVFGSPAAGTAVEIVA